MDFDNEQREMVLRAIYGLAKGQAGISVKMTSVGMQTGLDDADVARAAEAMARDGRATIPSAGRVALTNAGMAAAKADAERESNAVFMD